MTDFKLPLRIEKVWKEEPYSVPMSCVMDADNQPIPLESLVAAVNEAGRWQPIETAPRDGTEFLGCWHGDMHVVSIRGDVCSRQMDDSEWMMPTHWTPLPAEPPTALKPTDTP